MLVPEGFLQQDLLEVEAHRLFLEVGHLAKHLQSRTSEDSFTILLAQAHIQLRLLPSCTVRWLQADS